MAPGCPLGDGVHVNEMNVFGWSMDADTLQEVPDGEIGENVVTGYANTTQPLLNYRTHDLVRRRSSCACGRTWSKLEGSVLGRTDFMVTVRGTNVYQTAVENILTEVEGVSMHYELVLTHEQGNDCMRVRFEPDPSIEPAHWQRIATDAQERIHKALHVRLEVVPVEPKSLPRFELKTKRIIDQRPKELRRALDR
jgi:phenylacetate-CoA ligase